MRFFYLRCIMLLQFTHKPKIMENNTSPEAKAENWEKYCGKPSNKH